MLDELDLEDDYNFLHGYHKWVMIKEGFRGSQECQLYVCRYCRRSCMTVQGILRPWNWKPIMPPSRVCWGGQKGPLYIKGVPEVQCVQ